MRFTNIRVAQVKHTYSSRCWQSSESSHTVLVVLGKVGSFFERVKLNNLTPNYYPGQMKAYIRTRIWTQMLVEVLSIVTKAWDWMRKEWRHIHVTHNCSRWNNGHRLLAWVPMCMTSQACCCCLLLLFSQSHFMFSKWQSDTRRKTWVTVVGSVGGTVKQEQEGLQCGTACSVAEEWLLQDCVLNRSINIKSKMKM